MIGIIDLFQYDGIFNYSLRILNVAVVRSRIEELDDDSYYSLGVL